MSEKVNESPQRSNHEHVHMQADIIDQLNTNQQSNMTLSTGSVITQTESLVKLNIT
ncbi:hypothetical protein [Dethiobacter alkaliphilus]|uniref:hypothetical protein n=1 Tax=Dethiobacter alkaliphilus TaxID=427926 RepID=UPI002227CA33|nr:hypothetical protein [Dethiobacter alkaliphilus]MCW3490607.1 hypothetical protein [Dethiobacter alkaliphilus]